MGDRRLRSVIRDLHALSDEDLERLEDAITDIQVKRMSEEHKGVMEELAESGRRVVLWDTTERGDTIHAWRAHGEAACGRVRSVRLYFLAVRIMEGRRRDVGLAGPICRACVRRSPTPRVDDAGRVWMLPSRHLAPAREAE